jgi:hypothetical protein
MSFGNLKTRADLAPLFGPLSAEENERLLGRLLALDARLKTLAVEASEHVGISYRPTDLGLFVRANDAEVAGGRSGEAGDIWFEVGFSGDPRSLVAPPWLIESKIIVFCVDPNTDGQDACTHDLVRLVETARSPEATLDALDAHITTIERELRARDRQLFTQARHAELP